MSHEREVHFGSGDGSFQTNEPPTVIQTQFLDSLRTFLLSQRQTLQSQLETLQNLNENKKIASGSNEPIESSLQVSPPSEPNKSKEVITTPPQTPKSELIQICPVCGLEFENSSSSSDDLESHVLAHWESNVVE